MKIICDNCNLKNQLEEYRCKLNELVLEKKSLLDNEVIDLSKLLDNLINNCVFCSNNLNLFFKTKIKLKDIFNIHSAFYYYGEKHLFTNMYLYINEGIKNEELIYVSMSENLFVSLIRFLKNNNISMDYIKYRPIKELVMSNKYGGLSRLKRKINKIIEEDELKKYKGIRWIGQPTYAIGETSQADFLSLEINLNKVLENTNISLLYIYDAYDYMYEGKFVNKQEIKGL
ncbi:MEDS domain-containing protein [Anaerovorax odorimutans]|uniref:MEDS domain-containing protein n=1 Tax=Anaerovorax odorimutans TaxID=109327 RepID=UPI00040894C7|nr:MEDS domain-containing protein [Anaerovorax odorimutans]